MVVEHAYITVAEGQEADFEAAYVKAEPILAGAEGCRATELFRDVERPGGYLLRVSWERLEDHLEVFPTSSAGKEFAAHVGHFFAAAPEVRHFADGRVMSADVTDGATGAAVAGTDFTVETATPAVEASFASSSDPRLREITQSLARHLHAFVLEVNPSLGEWESAIGFLTEVGQWCSDTRQEFILLSDVLGVSMLVETLNGQDGGTESTVLGPFHMTTSPTRELGGSMDLLGRDRVCVVSGQVRNTSGDPLPGAQLDVWQCTGDGFYDVQQPDVQPAGNGRGLFHTDEEGRYWFRTVVPSHYPIPTDGPVGRLLHGTGRHPYRPAHIHFIAEAEDHETLTTHAFVAESPYIDSDAVFAVKRGLLVDFVEETDSQVATGYGVEVPFVHAQFDIVLQQRP